MMDNAQEDNVYVTPPFSQLVLLLFFLVLSLLPFADALMLVLRLRSLPFVVSRDATSRDAFSNVVPSTPSSS